MRSWKGLLMGTGLAVALAGVAEAQGPRGHARLDANRDGVLTREEAAAGVAEAAKRLDTNGDGMISIEEFTASRLAWFDKMDRNGDGVIDQSERPHRRGGRRAGPPSQP